jgi:dihydrofolate reductase
MTRIVAELFTSLNGVVKPRQNWHGPYCDEAVRHRTEELLSASRLVLLNRVTYHDYAEFWPATSGRMAELMNAIPKLVVSNSLSAPHWQNTTVLPGELGDQIDTIKAHAGGDILVTGSVHLVKTLIRLGQLSELRLLTDPTVLAGGPRIFDGIDGRDLTLVEAHPFQTGAVSLTYAFSTDLPHLTTSRRAA